MLSRVKILLGLSDDSQDALLNILMEDAISEALVYSDMDVYDKKLDNVVSRMIVIKYNSQGQDGILSQNYSGASESYTNGYPADILEILGGYRKARFL